MLQSYSVLIVKPKVFVTRRLPEKGMATLREHFEIDLWEGEDAPPKAEIVKRIADADAMVSLLTDPIDAEVIAAGKKLGIIAQYAVGYNNIDLQAAAQRGIIVTNTPEALTQTTSDLVFALLMAIARRIPEADRYVRNGKWKVAWAPELMLGQDVHGKTLGIVGFGRIGVQLAYRSAGFGMKVLYCDNQKNEQAEKEVNAKKVELDELLRESDFISLNVPLSEHTRGMISEKQLAMMKPTAYLINTSRGPVVDEKALAEALKMKKIAGAALDVFDKEPLPSDSPFLKLDNVVLVPHIGSATRETRERMGAMVADNLIAFFAGRNPPNPVAAKK
ncbi:Glyoxylate reductase [Candidatus Norongarragalina meridionalis]|nr:Glyoxylate reductase [Candidatus Norongarragalina meridionalis]